MTRSIKQSEKGIELKSIEYPVIYSYIYERESEDIKRLSDKFKNTKIRKPATIEVKTITSFRRDDNGRILPVYESVKPKQEVRRKIHSAQKAKNPSTRKTSIRKPVRKPKPSED